jgi:hypothetical protein
MHITMLHTFEGVGRVKINRSIAIDSQMWCSIGIRGRCKRFWNAKVNHLRDILTLGRVNFVPTFGFLRAQSRPRRTVRSSPEWRGPAK